MMMFLCVCICVCVLLLVRCRKMAERKELDIAMKCFVHAKGDNMWGDFGENVGRRLGLSSSLD